MSYKQTLIVIGILLTGIFFKAQTVEAAGYCSGGTWEGFDKVPASCNDSRCTATGIPYSTCVCTAPYCNFSYVAAGEPPCTGNSQQSQCSTPQWECNNGVSCQWNEPTNTPVPPGPTNTPVPGQPTNTPAPAAPTAL